uniref:Uncharacterized protein n=1 Tax=Lotharella oceanica TaxID=641309 RepID=A0A7S2TUH8_9EUKA
MYNSVSLWGPLLMLGAALLYPALTSEEYMKEWGLEPVEGSLSEPKQLDVAKMPEHPGDLIKDSSFPEVQRVRRKHAILATVLFALLSPGVIFRLTGMGSLVDGFSHAVLQGFLYRLLSGNRAGGYYGGEWFGHGMLSNLPQHFKDIYNRKASEPHNKKYRTRLLAEYHLGIYRTLNALESALGFFIFFPRFSLIPGGPRIRNYVSPSVLGFHSIVYYVAHRQIAALNIGESYYQMDGKSFGSFFTETERSAGCPVTFPDTA